MSEKLLPELREWLSTLSAETKSNLTAVLDAVIPVVEVVIANPLNTVNHPINDFDFSKHGVSQEAAERLFSNALRWKIGSNEVAIEDGNLFLTPLAIEQLKASKAFLAQTLTPQVRTDLERGIFVLDNKTVEISVGGRETYPLALLKVLVEGRSKYWFKDEIWERWEGGGKSQEMMDRFPDRVYHAARDLNEKLARAGAPDFLEFDTTKVRINPQYLDAF
jgi:hypothetical protein